MESMLFSFSDFPENVQLRILSFLDPFELQTFAGTSKKYLALCRYGERPLIERSGLPGQWLVSQVQPPMGLPDPNTEMGRRQNLLQKALQLSRMSQSECGGCYCVMKRPFLWMTVTSDGKARTYLDTTTGSVSLTEEDLSREDSEKLRSGLILVNIRVLFSELSVEENHQFFEFRRRLSTRNGRTEIENVYRSPPDRLMTEIYKILADKISLRGDATSNKERRRERQREREKWLRVRGWDSQHFFKPRDLSPTPSRPFQGLWKGVSPDGSLNFYKVCYDGRRGHIFCGNIGSTCTLEPLNEIVFTTPYRVFIEPPYPPEEESMYNSRVHVRPPPCAEPDQPDHNHHVTSSYDQDVVRMYYAKSNNDMNPLHLLFDEYDEADGRIYEEAGGRIWVYADGTFGFGFFQDDYIVHLKPMIKNDRRS
ncbi:F-box protein At3g12350-like [Henckelia pumila]|uniref:F-box protein At3g12350-like n=1 Tax=Henckelia pumila TaxID=405737 RepID=UPI003C6E721B